MTKEYYRKNKTEILRKRALYVAANIEKCYAAARAYHQRVKNDPAVKSREKAYYLKRKDMPAYKKRSLEATLRWNKRNPDKVKASQADYRKNNGAKIRAASLSWRNRNLEKARANEKRWRLAHPEYSAAKTFKRCALKRTSKINLAAINEFIRSIKTKPRTICYYCEKNISTKGCHFDHIVPLSKGGPHEISNICVSCASCNHSKHNKSIGAWIRVGQQVLNL